MKTVKKIVSVILNTLLVLLTAVCCIVMVKNAVGAEPTVLGFRIFYIVTGSMEPTIPVGAAVLVHAGDTSAYEPGDVITFRAAQQQIAGQPNTHRIIEKFTENGVTGYRTQGDANPTPDAEPVYESSIYGKVVWSSGSVKWLGTVMGLVTTPMGFFTCIIIPVMVIAAFAIRDFSKEYTAAMEEEARKQFEEEQKKFMEQQAQAQAAQTVQEGTSDAQAVPGSQDPGESA